MIPGYQLSIILNQYCTNATFFLNILQYFQVFSSNYCTLIETINIEEYIGKEWLKKLKISDYLWLIYIPEICLILLTYLISGHFI